MRILIIVIGMLVAASTLSAHPATHQKKRSTRIVVVKKTTPAPKKIWIAGHWKKAPRGSVWVPGHWKRI